ncbi:MAG: HPr family phosphocarrier protein [Alphaproteobacteria bacterium]|nr:HPr family phosphocarrier protein [Alphaproteobacteria bacterium]MBU0797409.1 HPr family phosphocarrier protein [Alphaproteobacteria bacterium]MBU0888528.1 HPr family phosphocarrier protein [Alphaproteobacteria bacterium]MBU1813738.1 HPr family phosphocarrier protein [Alphaproteobacteria bacterium]MBU2091972.1 HPr family phosphocarrier protein [Alphaproteobacteria bacterium]
MSTDTAICRTLTILNKRGLHARAAAKFVKLADTFEADIQVSKSGTTVSGLSIMGLMMLAAAPGCTIDIAVTGPQGAEAADAIAQLVADKFGEE